MAFVARHNITTVLTQDLVTAGDNAGNIVSINIANVHNSSTVKVDLILHSPGNDHYIIKNVEINSGASLQVDTRDIAINTNSADSLRIKLGSAVPVDVLINTIR
jgi:hypothetical protein|tara:strand:+ start:1585 stop:1896 length:312 start_codon:yes stop_codon:yes gene_type:complete